jgi:hypothetical protein
MEVGREGYQSTYSSKEIPLPLGCKQTDNIHDHIYSVRSRGMDDDAP